LAGSLYPAGLLLGVIGLLVLIFTYLLPKVGELVALGQKAPPDAMLRLLAISHFMHADGWLLAVGAAAAIAGLLAARGTKRGRRFLARLQLRLPVVGGIVRGYAVADVTKNYRAMYLGGVLPGENLEVCAEATENEAVQAALLRSKDLLENSIIGADGGESPVAEAFRVTGIFPPLAVTIIANGERTATLGEALERVSQIYSDEVRKSIKRAISAYTMGMSLFTAAIVGYVVISVWQTIADISASV
jgi:type II secretory pathway component PulF